MYKVLLVDDERIIVEGISKIVNWQAYGAELIGTARNGIDALQFIEENRPDIVISDIKMPGMDGLQLVQKLSELDPSIAVILLSGFSEFDYAQKAMNYGVKHYLLKPCNENTIIESLQAVISDLETAQSTESFIDNIQKELRKVLPYAKEQFLKELVTNKMYGKRDWQEYGRLFHIEPSNEDIRLVLFHLEGSYEFEHLFAIRNIAQDVLDSDTLLFSTTISTDVLLLVSGTLDARSMLEKLQEIHRIFCAYYKMEPTIAVSEIGSIVDARKLYRETQECLSYRFYLGDGTIITRSDIDRYEKGAARSIDYDDEQISLLVKLGDWQAAKQELEQYFQLLADSRMNAGLMSSYVIPLYIAVVRQGQPEDVQMYMNQLVQFEELTTLRAIEQFIMQAAEQISMNNYKFHTTKHSGIIKKMLHVIHEQLSNPELSLNWVASESLYMNADYLGKLFKKETGEKFSNYVMRLRMERAMAEIEATGDVKVFELAEKFGFGDNPQYFSQVFKKHTGFTPSEFKRSP